MLRPLAFVVAAFVAAAFALAGPAPAADKKDKPATSGTWTREVNGLDIKFEFVDKKTLKIVVMHDENGLIVTCSYTADKDAKVKVTITDVEVKGDFKTKPAKGTEFSFKWTVKDDTATLDDLTGEDLENAKPVVEGEYARKKDKK